MSLGRLLQSRLIWMLRGSRSAMVEFGRGLFYGEMETEMETEMEMEWCYGSGEGDEARRQCAVQRR